MKYLDLAIKLSEFAIDLDNYYAGRNSNLNTVKEVTEMLQKYQLKDTDRCPMGDFADFYEPLWKAMRKNSYKEIKYISELGLEMRLLRYELENISTNQKRSEELTSFLCNLSSEFMKMSHYRRQYRLAA
jgi:hypothetical protein